VETSRRLITAENKVQLFRIAILDTWVTKKTYGEQKSRDSVGDRRAGGCAASRGKANYVRGVRDPQSSPRADCRRHGAYRPALPGFGAVEEPEDFYRTDYRYR
jgi:hypothetical protein